MAVARQAQRTQGAVPTRRFRARNMGEPMATGPAPSTRQGSPSGSFGRLYGLFLRHQLTVGRVLAIGALKSGRDAEVLADITAVVEVAHAGGAIVKVIFENAYLTDDEKIRACGLTEVAGADKRLRSQQRQAANRIGRGITCERDVRFRDR